jgi:hypothetical protein
MTGAIYIAGHSLGAAEACLAAWSRIRRGLPVAGVYTFGCPRPGNSELGVVLSHVPIWRSIRNDCGHLPDYDLVTAVPFDVEAWLDYAQPAPFEAVAEQPAPNDPWLMFRYHHIELYAAGCAKLPPTGSGAGVELMDAVTAVQDLYDGTGDWTWTHFVDGQYCAIRTFTNGDKLLVFRGSETELDWIHDLETLQLDLFGAKVSRGFWSGPEAVQAAVDAVLAA